MHSSNFPKRSKTNFSNTFLPFTGYLARPRLGNMRSKIGRNVSLGGNQSGSGSESRFKKNKARKLSGYTSKPESKKRTIDYTDLAYNEAVSRLRVLLNENSSLPKGGFEDSGDDTDDRSVFSNYSRLSRYHYHSLPRSKKFPTRFESTKPTYNTQLNLIQSDVKVRENVNLKPEIKETPTEVMSFIERQEDYIDQLERESQYCRSELAGLLGKVKEVISENEQLHERQRVGLFKSPIENSETEISDDHNVKQSSKYTVSKRVLEGPSIVFESRISELEAQLTQTKIDLKKVQEENLQLQRQLADHSYTDNVTVKRQIDMLQRDKENLQDTISKLELAAAASRENSLLNHGDKSLTEQIRWEKTRAENEVRRLQSELQRVRENSSEQVRRALDEKDALERRYTQQVDQLSSDLAVQWDTTSKLQLELEKQRRDIADLKRDIAQKNAYIDDLKKELQSKMVTLQSEQSHSSAEKCSLEQELANAKLAADRNDRINKQEVNRLNSEIVSLRQRLDRADADALHMRRENLRLAEQLATTEKELNIKNMMNENRSQRDQDSSGSLLPVIALPSTSPRVSESPRDKELSSVIMDMEAKHEATVADLEGMIQSQNALMEKLTNECHSLTQRLEESSVRHKKEMAELQNSLKYLSNKLDEASINSSNREHADEDMQPHNVRNAAPQHNAYKLSDTNNVNGAPREIQKNTKIDDLFGEPSVFDDDVKAPDKEFDFDYKTEKDFDANEAYERQEYQPEYEQSDATYGEQEPVYEAQQDYTSENNAEISGYQGQEYENQQYDQEYTDQQYSDQQYNDGQYNKQEESNNSQLYDQEQYDPNQYEQGQDYGYDPNAQTGSQGFIDPNQEQYSTEEVGDQNQDLYAGYDQNYSTQK